MLYTGYDFDFLSYSAWLAVSSRDESPINTGKANSGSDGHVITNAKEGRKASESFRQ